MRRIADAVAMLCLVTVAAGAFGGLVAGGMKLDLSAQAATALAFAICTYLVVYLWYAR